MSKLLELADAYAGAKFIDALNGKYEGEIAIARAALAAEIERVRRQTIEKCAKVCEQQMTGANELMDTTREMDARAIRKLLVD